MDGGVSDEHMVLQISDFLNDTCNKVAEEPRLLPDVLCPSVNVGDHVQDLRDQAEASTRERWQTVVAGVEYSPIKRLCIEIFNGEASEDKCEDERQKSSVEEHQKIRTKSNRNTKRISQTTSRSG
jgi:hypothetical protein